MIRVIRLNVKSFCRFIRLHHRLGHRINVDERLLPIVEDGDEGSRQRERQPQARRPVLAVDDHDVRRAAVRQANVARLVGRIAELERHVVEAEVADRLRPLRARLDRVDTRGAARPPPRRETAAVLEDDLTGEVPRPDLGEGPVRVPGHGDAEIVCDKPGIHRTIICAILAKW